MPLAGMSNSYSTELGGNLTNVMILLLLFVAMPVSPTLCNAIWRLVEGRHTRKKRNPGPWASVGGHFSLTDFGHRTTTAPHVVRSYRQQSNVFLVKIGESSIYSSPLVQSTDYKQPNQVDLLAGRSLTKVSVVGIIDLVGPFTTKTS